MKELAIAFLVASLLTSTTLVAKGEVVGTYTGGKVTTDQVMEQFESVLAMQPQNKGKKFSELDKNIQELLVRGYINQKLFEEEAISLGISDSKEFKAKLQAAEAQLLQQELIERHLKTAITDKMLDDEYKKLVKSLRGQKEVKASHILVDTEEKAKELKKKLNKGSKFVDLVKEFSKDEGSKANAGDLDYVGKGQLIPEFESKAFSMKKGETSDPVKTQFGWHIIKILDFRNVKIPTKEQAENSIKAKLSRQIIENHFTELSKKAKVQITL